MTHHLPIRVYYEDTDAGGVVYYANYLKYYERARTEFLRALGINQQVLAQTHDAMFVVRHAALDYLRPARLDDALEVRSVVEIIKHSTIVFQQSVWRDDVPLSQAHIKVACVSATAFTVREIPSLIRDLLNNDLH